MKAFVESSVFLNNYFIPYTIFSGFSKPTLKFIFLIFKEIFRLKMFLCYKKLNIIFHSIAFQ